MQDNLNEYFNSLSSRKLGGMMKAIEVSEKEDYKKLREKILQETQFLDNCEYEENKTIESRIKVIKLNIKEIPTCKCGCNQKVRSVFANFISGHQNKSEEIKQKKKDSCMERFGAENPFASDQIKKKKKESCLQRYGVDHYAKTAEFKENYTKLMLEKYGVENYFQTQTVIDKNKEFYKTDEWKQCIENRKVKFKTTVFERMKEKLKEQYEFLFEEKDYNGVNGIYKFKCRKCNTIVSSNLDDGKIPRCNVCNPLITSKGQSIIENEIANFIRSIYKDSIIEHSRSIIAPQELDIYIKERKIAIELDGLYWHSDDYVHKNYHLDKTNKCTQNNIHLIHIFEDEWNNKQRIVKNRLKHLLKFSKYSVGGRQVEIKTIDFKLKKKFLNKYHIQGNDNSSILLGAFYKNRLVAVMTFGKLRKALGNSPLEGSYELYRFCTMGSLFSFPGLFSKMLAHFKNNYEWQHLLTYADRRWSNGEVYSKNGFTLHHISVPNHWYFKNGENRRYHRFCFRKDRLHKILTNFDEKLSENENMKLNGWSRIFDCGNLVFNLDK